MRLSAILTLALALAPLAAQAQDNTVYAVSYIDVAPAAKGQAATLLRALVAASRKEAGAMRFEALQRTSPSNQFVVLETWKDKAARDAHLAAAHTKTFGEKLTPHLLSPVDERICVTTFVAPASAAQTVGALYVVTHVDIPGNVRDKAVAGLKDLFEASRKDKGNLRFDVVHQPNRTNHFTVMEVWKDQGADDAHELAAHTKAFRDILTPITGALYDQRFYKAL
jgi:autoinducer 2-degrading protein